MNKLSSQRNFALLMQVLRAGNLESRLLNNFNMDGSISESSGFTAVKTLEELEKLYDEAFSNSKPRKITKEVKRLLNGLLAIMEMLFRKGYIDFTEFEWFFFSNLVPEMTVFDLKYNIYQIQRAASSLEVIGQSRWTQEWDESLITILARYFPLAFKPNSTELVKWTAVAKEVCMRIGNIRMFKTDKQCKERWLNHLNPYLKKQSWSLEEDCILMESSIKFKNKWSSISKALLGRTQHSVKNRFIVVINKVLDMKKSEIRELIKKKEAWKFAVVCLNGLKETKKEQNAT